MRSTEVRLGTKVVVTTEHRKPELRGLRGVIVGRYGNPDYLALDVQFEDGATELFWHHQLEEVEDEVLRSPSIFGFGR